MVSNIHLYRFYRHKYGKDLRCDAMPFSYIKPGLLEHPVHRENFYCIILVENGNVKVKLNDRPFQASAGSLICGLPGEIWEWPEKIEMEGKVVIFEPDFVLSLTKDSMILDRFGFINPDRESPMFKLTDKTFLKTVQLMGDMDDFIHSDNAAKLLIQSMLIYLLSLLNNDYPKNRLSQKPNMTIGRYADGFVKLVGTNLYRYHDVVYYADRLCITPNYLNKISHQALGVSSRRYIRSRIIAEAKNLLTITSMTSAEISATLGFESPSYFSRLFKKATGLTPLDFRNRQSGKDC